MTGNVLNSAGLGDSELSADVRFGEILITQHREIVLRCSFCAVRHRIYKKFLEHILAHYCPEVQQSKRIRAQERQVTMDEPFNTQTTTKLVLDRQQINRTHVEPESSSKGDGNIMLATGAVAQNEQFCEQVSVSSDESLRGPPPLPPFPQLTSKKKVNKSNKQIYKCETCGAACRGWGNWRVHCRRHIGEKPHKCHHCEKRFCTTTERTSHERRHTGERPFVCVFCGQSYFSSGLLSRHEREHKGPPPYKCDVCEKDFFHADRLRDHLLVHTEERNHVCNICNAAFARARNLKVHMKMHRNVREYQCNLCDLAFNQLESLWMHNKNNHKLINIDRKPKYTEDYIAKIEPQ